MLRPPNAAIARSMWRALFQSRRFWYDTPGLANAAALEGLVEDQQPIGFGVGQRLDQDAVDHAEQRGVDADAERQAEDDDRSDTPRS